MDEFQRFDVREWMETVVVGSPELREMVTVIMSDEDVWTKRGCRLNKSQLASALGISAAKVGELLDRLRTKWET